MRELAPVAEAVVAEAIVELAEQHDVVLQRDIGAPASTAAAPASATAESAATTAAAREGRATAATVATETHLAARRGYARRAPGRYATQCTVASATAASTGNRAAGPIRCRRTVAAKVPSAAARSNRY